jgi:hypothetical protein
VWGPGSLETGFIVPGPIRRSAPALLLRYLFKDYLVRSVTTVRKSRSKGIRRVAGDKRWGGSNAVWGEWVARAHLAATCASKQLAPRQYTAKLSPMRLTSAIRRIIEGIAREKTTYPHIDRIGPRLRSHLYSRDRSLRHIPRSEVATPRASESDVRSQTPGHHRSSETGLSPDHLRSGRPFFTSITGGGVSRVINLVPSTLSKKD